MILPNGDWMPDDAYTPMTRDQFNSTYGNRLNYDRYIAAHNALGAPRQAPRPVPRRPISQQPAPQQPVQQPAPQAAPQQPAPQQPVQQPAPQQPVQQPAPQQPVQQPAPQAAPQQPAPQQPAPQAAAQPTMTPYQQRAQARLDEVLPYEGYQNWINNYVNREAEAGGWNDLLRVMRGQEQAPAKPVAPAFDFFGDHTAADWNNYFAGRDQYNKDMDAYNTWQSNYADAQAKYRSAYSGAEDALQKQIERDLIATGQFRH